MDNKNEWDELEKWNKERLEKSKEKFGDYPSEFYKNEKIDKFAKGLKATGKVFAVIKYIVVTIVFLILCMLIIQMYANINANIKNQSIITESSTGEIIVNL